MNQVMTPFQQQFGKPCLCRAILSVWEITCYCRGTWRILPVAVDQYPERWPVLWWLLSLNDHHTIPCGNNQRNLDHVWPQEGPGDEVILAGVYNWTQQYRPETAAQSTCLVLEWFLVALSRGKVPFSDECAVYCSSLSWNVFWGKAETLLHIWDVRLPTTHDDSAVVTASYIVGTYFCDGTVSGVTCSKRGIALYQSQATVGLCNRRHFSYLVPQCISAT